MLTYNQGPRLFGPAAAMTSSVQSQSANGLVNHYPPRHIWIITGPAGCGKSTVAKFLANKFSMPYIEGDEYHPEANIDKMAAGIPLTDADRWDWLILLREQAVSALAGGASGVVVTCSALKKKYRDEFRIASLYSDVQIHFVYLQANEEILLARVKARKGHYMKDNMVRSQFNCLEEPTKEELQRDVLSIDVSGSVRDVERLAVSAVNKIMSSA